MHWIWNAKITLPVNGKYSVNALRYFSVASHLILLLIVCNWLEYWRMTHCTMACRNALLSPNLQWQFASHKCFIYPIAFCFALPNRIRSNRHALEWAMAFLCASSIAAKIPISLVCWGGKCHQLYRRMHFKIQKFFCGHPTTTILTSVCERWK